MRWIMDPSLIYRQGIWGPSVVGVERNMTVVVSGKKELLISHGDNVDSSSEEAAARHGQVSVYLI
jgi:hypothetical protein